MDNLIITPHIGGADSKSLPNMTMLPARNIDAGLNGKKIPSSANPEIYHRKPKLLKIKTQLYSIILFINTVFLKFFYLFYKKINVIILRVILFLLV